MSVSMIESAYLSRALARLSDLIDTAFTEHLLSTNIRTIPNKEDAERLCRVISK